MAIERVGVAFEPELLRDFDLLIRKKGYASRSEAVRDLVRRSIIESAVKDDGSEVIGTLTIIYDHDAPGVTDRLLDIQHRHHEEIMTNTHIHLDESGCLEVLIVRGRSRAVRTLADNIKALKGVRHGELVITANNR
jgi:CopG family nickel-responsive transcriptional regulator